jgi:hypothetical protein
MVAILVVMSFAFFIGLHLALRWHQHRRALRTAEGVRGPRWTRAAFPTLGILMQDGGEPISREPIGKSEKDDAAEVSRAPKENRMQTGGTITG